MNSKGQILVPSLFVFPSLVLFAILIVEVAKLSQQKVLMQFAIDTSVFMEASQASDMANRMAYLNSPWPTRVFQQADGKFINWPVTNYSGGSVPGKTNVAEIFLRNGVYPGSIEEGAVATPPGEGWKGRFRALVPGKPGDASPPDPQLVAMRNSLNTERPPEDLGTLVPFTYEDIDQLNFPDYESAIQWYQEIYAVYSYLNQLSTMVKLVYEKLHAVFFEKTFWLNTGFKIDKNLAPSIMRIQEHKTMRVRLWYTRQDNQLGAPIPYSNESEIKAGSNVGMWQLSTVEELAQQSPLHVFNFGNYYYAGPPNHFGIVYRDLFNGYDPYVTASAEVSGGRVWPDPMPTFQVRLRP